MATANLLYNCYGKVFNLHEYITEIIPSAQLLRGDEPASFGSLLQACIVTRRDGSSGPECIFKYYPPQHSQFELISRAQLNLLRLRQRQNVLVLGHRLADDRDQDFDTELVAVALNSAVNWFRSSDWRLLLTKIGENPMLHILTKCSLFTPIGGDSYIQMSGLPISEYVTSAGSVMAPPDQQTLKRPAEAEVGVEVSRKRVRLSMTEEVPPIARVSQLNTPKDIQLMRNRMMHARPEKSRSGPIRIGLPRMHVLRRTTTGILETDSPALVLKKNQAYSRHISKYMFPRQYHLENIFSIPKDTKCPYPFKDYEDREDEILLKGRMSTPKSLREVLPLIEKLGRLHFKTKYHQLCNFICPSKLKGHAAPDVLESTGILEIDSAAVGILATQPAVALGQVESSPEARTDRSPNLKRREGQKPRFAEFACSHTQVFRLVSAVTKSVIPDAFFGSNYNRKLIMSHVVTWIACRRQETLSLHDVLQGFKIADCKWLLPHSIVARMQRLNANSDMKRRELLHEFVYWLFESFVSPLIKNTFYVTESSAFRNQVLYFRHDDWAKLCAPLLHRLSADHFEPLNWTTSQADAILRARKMGYSYIRLIPKETGVRPIVNLRRKPKTGESINRVLQNVFEVLTYEKSNQPELLGASVFGMNEVYGQLKAFRKRVIKPDRTLPKLYFVKVDVKAAFDTIDQDRLVNILFDLLSEEEYSIRRWSRVVPTSKTSGGAKRTFHKRAVGRWDEPQFSHFAETLCKVVRSAIFVDQVSYKAVEKAAMLQLLEEHIKHNIVKIGAHFYRQKIGIAQGSVLSTLLCSFFYGDLERLKFDFRADPRNLLLRYIDDYLFITASRSMARKFLDVMSKGHPEYGCFISSNKTLTNFACNVHLPNVTALGQTDFPWCGIRINMQRLSVQGDYHRLHDIHVSDTLNVHRGRNAGTAFRQKMMHAAQLRSHVIYHDTSPNGRKVVYINSFQGLALTAMKMHAYLKSWRMDGTTAKRGQFILDTIMRCIQCSYSSIRKKVVDRLGRENKACYAIQKASFTWLGIKAFHSVLMRKPTSYAFVLEGLGKHMRSRAFAPRTKIQAARLNAIVRDAWAAGLTELRY